MTLPDRDPVIAEAWDRFRDRVRSVLDLAAPPAGPMPIYCQHAITYWHGRDGIPWAACGRCGAWSRNFDGTTPTLPPHIIGWTMPAAPNGTTMDVTDGGTK